MEKEITLVFHNRGLRSFIEVDLCAECPRQDDKGCCGFYSPVFYPTDLAFLLLNKPDLLDYIFTLDHLTILDASITVNNMIEGNSYRCKFHSKDGGCLLTQTLRESICRHFVCSGIGWWEEESMQDWHKFFEKLSSYEIELNNEWASILKGQGLTLRDPTLRPQFFDELKKLYNKELNVPPDFITLMPEKDSRSLTRPLSFGVDWIL
ncbi:MAG: hypothetical protein CVU90_15590 [Firmicutes bacterium HGW-Firmicutes-15]|nr:MAG: hypothetical protein CVU90_15590 [Firmicutes bacterium HGW-Firmicutes-15]